jgi:hypothetical protein
MIKDNLYIPAQSIDIALYFGTGLILPNANSISVNANHPNASNPIIIITKNKWADESNCSIEVLLSDDEKKNLLPIRDEVFAYELPIPITRIIHIYFKDNERMSNTLWNTNVSTAYIPKRLASVDEELTSSIAIPGFIREKQAIPSNIQHLINRFDVLLGGFALMKIATEPGLNFPRNYFATLSFFNQNIAADVRDAETKYNYKFEKKFTGLFTTKVQNEWSNWTKYIYGSVSLDDIHSLAANEKTKINTKLGIIQLDSIDTNSKLFDVALLASYGINKSKSLEDLLFFLQKSKLPSDKIEEIALLFGLHLGYSELKNNYNFDSKVVPVKFELESRLDYYIIESIYNYVFKGAKDTADLPYLEPVLPIHKTHIEADFYYILDHPVAFKESPSNEFQNFEMELYGKIAELQEKWMIPGFIFNLEASIKHSSEKLGPFIKSFIKTVAQRVRETKMASQSDKHLQTKTQIATTASDHSVLNTDDEYDQMTLSELKDVAKNKGITKLPKLKATKKDLDTLISIIRSTKNIL